MADPIPPTGSTGRRRYQAMRFGLVGLSGTAVNMAVAAACVLVGPPTVSSILGPVRWFHLYTVIAFCVAVVWNYHWNRRWTFSSGRPWLAGLFDFAAVSAGVQAIGLVVETLLVMLRPTGLPLTADQWWYACHAFAILVAFPIGWLANRRWTFGSRHSVTPTTVEES